MKNEITKPPLRPIVAHMLGWLGVALFIFITGSILALYAPCSWHPAWRSCPMESVESRVQRAQRGESCDTNPASTYPRSLARGCAAGLECNLIYQQLDERPTTIGSLNQSGGVTGQAIHAGGSSGFEVCFRSDGYFLQKCQASDDLQIFKQCPPGPVR